jgi:hypothetical protein
MLTSAVYLSYIFCKYIYLSGVSGTNVIIIINLCMSVIEGQSTGSRQGASCDRTCQD